MTDGETVCSICGLVKVLPTSEMCAGCAADLRAAYRMDRESRHMDGAEISADLSELGMMEIEEDGEAA